MPTTTPQPTISRKPKSARCTTTHTISANLTTILNAHDEEEKRGVASMMAIIQTRAITADGRFPLIWSLIVL